jgi:hypothetical protein
MNMDQYHHHISGFFPHRKQAESALFRLVERGLPRERLRIFKTDSAALASGAQSNSDEVLKDVVVDGAIGTAVGTGIGALGELVLVAANVSLFIASPLIAPLAMLGWGASLGALIGTAAGTATGAKHKEGRFADLIRDAISSGQVVLVAETWTAQETAIATEVIENAVGEYRETAAV